MKIYLKQPGDALATGIESAMNAWLGTDPQGAEKLSDLEGILIGLEVTTFPLELFFLPTKGRLRVFNKTDRQPHTRISGGLFDLVKIGVGEQGASTSARLTIEGNVVAGHAFQHILKAGDFDWEELLATRLGDVAAHELAQAVRVVGRWTARSFDSLSVAVGEYLQEETKLVVGGYEVNDFICEVDKLRDKIESLEVGIRHIKGKTSS